MCFRKVVGKRVRLLLVLAKPACDQLFLENTVQHRLSQTRTYKHPYESTGYNPADIYESMGVPILERKRMLIHMTTNRENDRYRASRGRGSD
jgi:hypothetical protein